MFRGIESGGIQAASAHPPFAVLDDEADSVHANASCLVDPAISRDMLDACGVQALSDPTVLCAFGARALMSHGDEWCIADTEYQRRVSGAERYAKVYNIDYNRCIFCGYCVEACPTDAITHGHGFELATFNASNLIYRKEQMLAPRPAHMGANIVFNQADVNGGAPAVMVPGS